MRRSVREASKKGATKDVDWGIHTCFPVLSFSLTGYDEQIRPYPANNNFQKMIWAQDNNYPLTIIDTSQIKGVQATVCLRT